MSKLQGKRVLFIIAHQIFRDEEYQIPREILEDEGAEVIVASTELSSAKGKLGLEVQPDILLKDVLPSEYDAILFVGGGGCKTYWDDNTAHAVAREFFESGKITAAICSAPVILSNAGLLKGRKATCFPDDREELEKGGVEYIDDDVKIDGNVITGKGYWAASDFANAIVSQLK